jgi:heat shock protein HslJ
MKKILIGILIVVFGILVWNASKQKQAPVQDIKNDQTNPSTVGTTTSDMPVAKLPAGSATPGDPKVLQDKTWVWQQTIVTGGGVITPNKPGVFTLTLATDGRAIGKTDCNGFGGGYKIGSDGVISFEPFMSTLMYCEGSQEAAYNTVLAQTNRYSVDTTGTLALSGPAGTVYFK